MIKDLTHTQVMMGMVLYGNISNPLLLRKSIRKSISRYWHRVNKKRRHDPWIPRIVGTMEDAGRPVQIQYGYYTNIRQTNAKIKVG